MTTSTHTVPEERIRALLTPSLALDSCRVAFDQVRLGRITNPPRTEQLEERGGASRFRLDMPAEWPPLFRGRKVIEESSDVSSGRLGVRQAWIELEDLSQDVSWRFDAGHITDMRTGAAAALALEALAGDTVRRVGLLGTGRISRATALCLDDLLPSVDLRSTSRNPANRAAFAADIGSQLSGSLHMAASLQECLHEVDAVVTAVPTAEPILQAGDVAHIDVLVVVGGDGRTRQLAPDLLETRSVVVDLLEQALASGEFRHARATNREPAIRLARSQDGALLTIPDATNGDVPSGQAVAYLTGLAAQDLALTVALKELLDA